MVLSALAPALIAPAGADAWRTFSALGSAAKADREVLAEVLSSSEEESAIVLAELAVMAMRGRAKLGGIDLLEAVMASPLRIACVVGPRDILAPRASARILSRSAQGPRLMIEIEDARHVDLIVGHHAVELVDRLWMFVVDP